MKIILQCITTTWETGAPIATAGAFEIASIPNENELLEHNVSLYQLDQWTKPRGRSRQTALQAKTVRDGLLLEVANDSLNVTYKYSGNIGTPERNNPTTVSLQPGEWARVIHNGKHTDAFEKKVWYSNVIWNIAHVLEFDAQVFIGSQPKVQHDDTVKLG